VNLGRAAFSFSVATVDAALRDFRCSSSARNRHPLLPLLVCWHRNENQSFKMVELRNSGGAEEYDSATAGSFDEDDAKDRLLEDAPEVSLFELDDGGDFRNQSRRRSFRRFFRGRRRAQDSNSASGGQCCARRRKKRSCRLCASFFMIILSLYGLYGLLELLLGLGPLIWSERVDPFFPNWGEEGQPGEGLSGYPTDFTRNVVPIPCHSHNDYWRRVPLYQAIHFGCTSVEADVWLVDDDLYVGHSPSSLTQNRTFRSLYVDPLVRILDRQNPTTSFVDGSLTRNGVFDEDPSQTLVLLVDFKTDDSTLFPDVESQLSSLRDRGYLSYWDGTKFNSRAVTVVGTGNTAFSSVVANQTYRDIFFDAPLHLLSAPRLPTTMEGQGTQGLDPLLGGAQFTVENSYYASTDFLSTIGFPWRGYLNENQLQKLREQIAEARKRGLMSRYWNTPIWPIGLRNHIWRVLVREGADVLNVDDLRAASRGDWRKRRNRDW